MGGLLGDAAYEVEGDGFLEEGLGVVGGDGFGLLEEEEGGEEGAGFEVGGGVEIVRGERGA